MSNHDKHKQGSYFPLNVDLKIFPIQHVFVFKVHRLLFAKSGNRGNDKRFYNTITSGKNTFRLPTKLKCTNLYLNMHLNA